VIGRTAVLSIAAACLVATAAVAQTYDVLKAFNSDGLRPHAGLIQGTDGNLYGTTAYGGSNNYGTIFKIDANGSTFTTLYTFAGSDGANPYAAIIQGTDGNLYGTTAYGGSNDYGTVFKVDTNGLTFTTLHNFAGSDGANPYTGLLQATDGNLYGTTYSGGANYGTIFKVDTNGLTFTTLHNFAGSDGANPYAGLLQATDGNLYGTTNLGGASNYGTIFKIDTNGTTFTTLHTFVNTDGANPYAGLLQATDGNLYGTTLNGGGGSCYYGCGTIFKIDTNGSMLTTLHGFLVSDGVYPYGTLIQGTDGNVYGTLAGGGANYDGAIFRIDTSGSTFTTLHTFVGTDGSYSYATLIQGTDRNLYGTTYFGGASYLYGTIFKVDTNGLTFTTLHKFAYVDGASPYALIQATDGNLYGTNIFGGPGVYGTLFRMDTSGTTFTTLRGFAYDDGAYPPALIQGTDGILYGTTANGGGGSCYYGCGTIFKIDANGTTFTTLHVFAGSDGAYPYALMQGTEGNLYGTSAGGGAGSCNGGCGTIFKTDTSGTMFTTLHSFAGSDFANPNGLIQATDGSLYGPTANGGGGSCNHGCGTIFKIDTNGITFVTLHSFDGSDGTNPYAGLIQGSDGDLYGTTAYGGSAGSCNGGCGTIFKIDTDGTTFTTLHNFDGSDGANPRAGLIQGTDGYLYGTTSQGRANNYATIFKIDTSGSILTTLHEFSYSDGEYPAALLQGTDGSLYGTAAGGGPGDGGVVFRLQASFVTLAVSPTSGPASGGTTVTLSGTGFDPTNTVSFNGVAATGVNFVGPTQIDATSPPLSPGTLSNVSVTSPTSVPSTLPKAFLADFLDVPQSDGFHDYVEKIFRGGITAGYGNGYYGRDDSVTRAQMAVFLLKGKHGSSYAPPSCTGVFADVLCPSGFAADWIEELSREGITAGCGAGNYCPNDPVTRAQMAVFLLSAKHGAGYAPPACAGLFVDVPCPGGFAVDWTEELFNEGITAGCGGSDYCPDNPSTRGEMAVFLVTTFGL